jgi:hypothetical protein
LQHDIAHLGNFERIWFFRHGLNIRGNGKQKKPVNQDWPGWRASLAGASTDAFVRAGK